ncbi:hypothetical protein FRACYDRAFT_247222 [Fragilariopsis cylindrus CCMP1102]|uniref:Uncharacterized protein n=1 Tax=Fragilariopsis cylindrus CCMP1102 TaxID=635003 RepID=A0A1E7EWE9_9STRA|nr:hypothetical protein FRACYDRAFT_247222 [Fragilariopsis cylindrus CCMP1102]|eukprot:OEU10291.1 hypothetical protein FRACYDRAFT_247222 [Fragilariopsis cylindrus CCMP1102]
MAKDQDSDYDDSLNSESNESSTISSDDTDSIGSVDANAESDNESTDTNTTGYVNTHPDIVTAIKKILPAFVKVVDSEQTQYVSNIIKIRNVYRSNIFENTLKMGPLYNRASRELDTDTNTDTN